MSKLLLSILLIAAALATRPIAVTAEPRAERDLPARQRVRDAKSYYCYYGPGRAAELSKFDVVILHTPAATPEVVKQLKDRGVVTIGYITCGEDETLRIGDGTGPGGKASWYFDKDKDGQPDAHPIWKSIFTNSGDLKWREDRIAEAKRLVNDVGFDGIFLDTVDDVTIYPETFDGMVQLIEGFRAALPAAPIIMNQSWELMRKVAPVIDGVMLEGFSTSYDFASKSYRQNPVSWIDTGLQNVKRHVVPVRRRHPFQVFVLDYAEPTQTSHIQVAADRAATFGFLHAVAPVELDAIYDVKVVGRPDKKWWERSGTPDVMSVTLDAPRNGFPAGTKVLPSSCFGGYAAAPLVDGIEDRSKLDWSQAAWASAEEPEAHWLEIQFPEPAKAGTLKILWEPSHPSRAFVVQARSAADAAWTDIATTKDNGSAVSEIKLPDQPYRHVRIIQDPRGGSPARPELMWVSRMIFVP